MLYLLCQPLQRHIVRKFTERAAADYAAALSVKYVSIIHLSLPNRQMMQLLLVLHFIK